MIKVSIQEKDISVVHIHAPSIGTPQSVKQILMDIKGEIDSNTVTVGNLAPHLRQ